MCSASKYGATGFGDALYDDLQYMNVSGVNVTTVYPMFVTTRMVTDLADRVVPKSRCSLSLSLSVCVCVCVSHFWPTLKVTIRPGFSRTVLYFLVLSWISRCLLDFTVSWICPGFESSDPALENVYLSQ